MHRTARLIALIVALPIVPGWFLTAVSMAQEENHATRDYTLRWSPQVGEQYTYMVSSSGNRGESIAVRSENFTIRVEDIADGTIHFMANGEAVPDNAPLAFRFQRALFTEFPYTVDSLGNTIVPAGQPFPVFTNIPIFPENPVSVGSTWSGGPVGILPDPNAGPIPFTFVSTFAAVSTYQGEDCALIESDYTVALPPDAKSYMPFLGLVQGDNPEQAGTGAPIGGVVENSRANLAGVQPGDFIIAAAGQRIRGWGGLEEILPVLVPEMPVLFRVRRGDQEFDISVAPEGVPLVAISGAGGLHSTCYFSLSRGIPLKTDVTSADLVFTLTNAQGETEEKEAYIQLVMEYQH